MLPVPPRRHCSCTYALTEGWGPEFVKATYLAWFIDGKLPGDPATISDVLIALDKEPVKVLSMAESQEIKRKHQDETDLARSLGIFGSPTFACGKEIFGGDDRLEEAIAWARSH